MSTNRKANKERGSPPAPALNSTPLDHFLIIDLACLEALGPGPAVAWGWVRFRGTGSEGCWQSLGNISKATGMGRWQVGAALSVLVETGWLSAKKRVGRPTVYQVAPRATYEETSQVPQGEPPTTYEETSQVPMRKPHTPHEETSQVPMRKPHTTSTTHKDEYEDEATRTTTAEFGGVIRTWESSAGPITPMIAEHLEDLAGEADTHRQTLPADSAGGRASGNAWVSEAIREAVSASRDGRISVRFIQSILTRWMREGYKAPFSVSGGASSRSLSDNDALDAWADRKSGRGNS